MLVPVPARRFYAILHFALQRYTKKRMYANKNCNYTPDMSKERVSTRPAGLIRPLSLYIEGSRVKNLSLQVHFFSFFLQTQSASHCSAGFHGCVYRLRFYIISSAE